MASQTPDVPPEKWWSKATVAVVTGSNKGLGQAIVLELVRRGVTVVATARNAALGRDAVDAARHAEPALADLLHFHQLDVTDEQSVAKLVAWLCTTFGGIDILINNAGVLKLRLEVYEDAAETMAVNFWGARRVTETLLPMLRALPAGARIVMIGLKLSLMKQRMMVADLTMHVRPVASSATSDSSLESNWRADWHNFVRDASSIDYSNLKSGSRGESVDLCHEINYYEGDNELDNLEFRACYHDRFWGKAWKLCF